MFGGLQNQNQFQQQQQQDEPVNAIEGEGFDQNLFNQQNQLWNQSKNLTAEQLQTQRNQQNNYDLQQTEVKRAKCTLPPTCELVVSIVQGAAFWALIYFNLIAENAEIPFRIMPAFPYIFFTIMKCFISSARFFLSNCVNSEQVKKYHQIMKQGNPVVSYSGQAYHYKTTGMGKNRRRRKVTSYSDVQQLVYTRCEDKTYEIDELLKTTSILRLYTGLYCHKGNQLASNNWQLLTQGIKLAVSGRDSHHRVWNSSYVPGLKRYQTMINSSSKCFFNTTVMNLSYLIGLGLIFDTLFYSVTGTCTLYVQKVVYCDTYMVDQFNSMMNNPLMNPNAQQQQVAMNPGMVYQQQPMMMQQQPIMVPQQGQMVNNQMMMMGGQQQQQFNNVPMNQNQQNFQAINMQQQNQPQGY